MTRADRCSFSLNSGAPYFYCAKSPSVSFADAPQAVDDSLRYIRDVVQSVLPRVDPEPEPVEFNEVLSIGSLSLSWSTLTEQATWRRRA